MSPACHSSTCSRSCAKNRVLRSAIRRVLRQRVACTSTTSIALQPAHRKAFIFVFWRLNIDSRIREVVRSSGAFRLHASPFRLSALLHAFRLIGFGPVGAGGAATTTPSQRSRRSGGRAASDPGLHRCRPRAHACPRTSDLDPPCIGTCNRQPTRPVGAALCESWTSQQWSPCSHHDHPRIALCPPRYGMLPQRSWQIVCSETDSRPLRSLLRGLRRSFALRLEDIHCSSPPESQVNHL